MGFTNITAHPGLKIWYVYYGTVLSNHGWVCVFCTLELEYGTGKLGWEGWLR